MSEVNALAPDGVGIRIIQGADVTVDRSTVLGWKAIYNPAGNTLRIGTSKVTGGLLAPSSATCVHSYDENYAPLGADCQ